MSLDCKDMAPVLIDEFVERPAALCRGSQQTPFVGLIAQTLENGKAVRVPINGAINLEHFRMRYRNSRRLVRLGRVRSRRDGDAFLFWLEAR